MEEFIKPFKALSDETRLRMLNILLQRECCVCEVMQVLNISQTRASRNLKLLEEAGFLKSRREGAWVYYSLRDDAAAGFAVSLAGLTGKFSEKLQLFRKDRARLKKAVRLGNTCCEKPSRRGKMKEPAHE
jgi:ArsR family transcriptional regulator